MSGGSVATHIRMAFVVYHFRREMFVENLADAGTLRVTARRVTLKMENGSIRKCPCFLYLKNEF